MKRTKMKQARQTRKASKEKVKKSDGAGRASVSSKIKPKTKEKPKVKPEAKQVKPKGKPDKKKSEVKSEARLEVKPKEKEKGEGKGKEIEKARGKEPELHFPFEEYKKSGIYLGTKVITGHMRKFVYKRRADGLAILNTSLIDERLALAAKFLSRYSGENVLIVCKRNSGWQAVEKFGEISGARIFTRRYPAGVITNPTLPEFFEPKILIVIDPWTDKNALNDALRVGVPIVSLCDTNNVTNNVDFVIPCNNKGQASLALVFWILAKGYVKERGLKVKVPKLEEFGGDGEIEAKS